MPRPPPEFLALCLLLALPWPGTLGAQGRTPSPGEGVAYTNAADGTRLSGTLFLPESGRAERAVVLLSIAGTAPLVERLLDDGMAVLTPVRRGFVDVEPLLRARYTDLAGDVAAALDYLASRPEVEGNALAVVAQGDDAPPAMIDASGRIVPLVLLAPPHLPGVERFRLEQRYAAERARWSETEVAALEEYVGRIAEIALESGPPYVREYRLNNVRAASPVQLPRSASFPADEGQMHFFASPLWHDRLAFDPGAALAVLRAPVLVLIGSEDANTPADAYVTTMRAQLAASASPDASIHMLPGRTRHVFTEQAVEAISAWLHPRLSSPG